MERRIGFIGLGNMGYPMAENFLKKFGQVMVYNRSQQKCLDLQKEGANIASNLKELMENNDIIGLSLPGPKHVEPVVEELLENGKEGQIIMDFSTISPALAVSLSNKAQEKGIYYYDMPVSGGPAGVRNAALSIMIGATQEEIEKNNLMPYLETIGKTFHFIGGRGNGQAIKIINNYMAFATQVINGEALAMADALGIDEDTFYNVVITSSGNNMILKGKMNKVKEKDYKPGFALDLVVKDLELARDCCNDLQMPNFTLNTGLQMYRLAQRKGCGALDSSSVIQVIRDLNKKGE